MRRFIRIALYVFVLLLIAGTGFGAWFLLLDGAAPPRRPDLIRLPEDLPPPPGGYPTSNALYLAYFLGRLELLDPLHVEVPDGVTETKDVEYGIVGERKLLLDLYAPRELDAPTAGLIFIHGGGWMKGNKSDYKFYTVRFAAKGYVAASIGYRFGSEAHFPAALEDAKCAIRWMRANAASLNVDPDRIVVLGGSAGGHLSMMAGYTADTGLFEGGGGHEGVSSAVRAVVDLYGPTDLSAAAARDHKSVTDFLGVRFEQDPDLFYQASPLYQVRSTSPPTLLFQGTIDDLVPTAQSDALAEKLIELGVPYWYDRIDGYPHTMDLAPEINERVFDLILRFLETHAGPAPEKP